MNKLMIASLGLVMTASIAMAQTTAPTATPAQPAAPSTSQDTPAVATPDSKNPDAPVAGANSFTEAQATERLEAAGFTSIEGLKLDDQGIWRAMAMKDSKSVEVALDYQGNIVAK